MTICTYFGGWWMICFNMAIGTNVNTNYFKVINTKRRYGRPRCWTRFMTRFASIGSDDVQSALSGCDDIIMATHASAYDIKMIHRTCGYRPPQGWKWDMTGTTNVC